MKHIRAQVLLLLAFIVGTTSAVAFYLTSLVALEVFSWICVTVTLICIGWIWGRDRDGT